jgi:hypothetical protein
MVRYVVDKHIKQEYDKMLNAYDHIVGITSVKKGKYYMIDVDVDDIRINSSFLKEFEKVLMNSLYILRIQERMPEGEIIKVPTKNGFHILTPAFSTDQLQQIIRIELPEYHTHVSYDIKKDAETVLYIP